jgi:hypothetical protein
LKHPEDASPIEVVLHHKCSGK